MFPELDLLEEAEELIEIAISYIPNLEEIDWEDESYVNDCRKWLKKFRDLKNKKVETT